MYRARLQPIETHLRVQKGINAHFNSGILKTNEIEEYMAFLISI